MSQYTQVVISLPAQVLAQVRQRLDPTDRPGGARNNVSGRIATDLSRHYETCRQARRELGGMFSPRECGLILDACRGMSGPAETLRLLLLARIADACDGDAPTRFDVDGAALESKINGLTYAQAAALQDAVERWQLAADAGAAPEYSALLAG